MKRQLVALKTVDTQTDKYSSMTWRIDEVVIYASFTLRFHKLNEIDQLSSALHRLPNDEEQPALPGDEHRMLRSLCDRALQVLYLEEICANHYPAFPISLLGSHLQMLEGF